jgi:short subunit fatty acids transporter
MKIISNLLETIEGIENWYIAGLLIFFFMFIIFLIRTLMKPRQEMEEIKNSILDDETGENEKPQNKTTP